MSTPIWLVPPITSSAVIPDKGAARDPGSPSAPGKPGRLTRAQKDALLAGPFNARPCGAGCAENAPGIAMTECCLTWPETTPEFLARGAALQALADRAAADLLHQAEATGYAITQGRNGSAAAFALSAAITTALVALTRPEGEGG